MRQALREQDLDSFNLRSRRGSDAEQVVAELDYAGFNPRSGRGATRELGRPPFRRIRHHFEMIGVGLAHLRVTVARPVRFLGTMSDRLKHRTRRSQSGMVRAPE